MPTRSAPLVPGPAAQAATVRPSARALARRCDCGNHAAGGTCPHCAEEQRKRRLARFAAPACAGPATAPAVPPIVHDVLRGSGRRLPGELRAFVEPCFGRDFSDVRVHTDGEAARSARAVGARAYTVGSHVVFGHGEFRPGDAEGRRLIAHELTHVVQQRGAAGASDAPDTISDPADAAEREAEAVAERVLAPDARHAPGAVSQAPSPMPGVAAPAAAAPIAATPSVPVLERKPSEEDQGRIAAGTLPRIAQRGAGVQRLPESITGIGTGFAAVGAFGLGVAIGTLAGAFDRDVYSTGELIAYLDGLARRRRHEGGRSSDNKARDVVRHWLAGDRKIDVSRGHAGPQGALTPVDLKRLLIAEMLDGATTGPDEDAILDILERSTAAEILEIVDPAKGVSVNRLLDDLDGDNNARLRALFDRRFPQGSAVRAQQEPDCRATEAVMISIALKAAEARVVHAIQALSRPNDPDVKPALDCRFHGASAAQIVGIQATFERIRALLPSRQFFCLHGTEALHGVDCSRGQEASSFVNGIPDIALCPKFFRSDPEEQATTLIHEVGHAAGVDQDIQTKPPCGWELALALQEPDSYALLASELFAARGQRPAPAPAPAAPAGGGAP